MNEPPHVLRLGYIVSTILRPTWISWVHVQISGIVCEQERNLILMARSFPVLRANHRTVSESEALKYEYAQHTLSLSTRFRLSCSRFISYAAYRRKSLFFGMRRTSAVSNCVRFFTICLTSDWWKQSWIRLEGDDMRHTHLAEQTFLHQILELWEHLGSISQKSNLWGGNEPAPAEIVPSPSLMCLRRSLDEAIRPGSMVSLKLNGEHAFVEVIM